MYLNKMFQLTKLNISITRMYFNFIRKKFHKETKPRGLSI